MGSLSGTCEIVESTDDLVPHAKGNNLPSSRLRLDEKLGKLPMLKTARNTALEDDLNHIFEAIDRRAAARSLNLSQQSDASTSSKNASKKPVRVGASQASGIGISESVSLKQALRGLCISHASEMAAIKRSSKQMNLSPGPEGGALQRLYRSVVVEASGSGLPLDEGKGGVVEISLLPEKRESDFSGNIAEPVTTSSSNPSALSSPKLTVATRTKAQTTKIRPLDDTTTRSAKIGAKSPILKNLRPLSTSNTVSEVPELEEIVPASTSGSKTSKLELVRKGHQKSSVHSSSIGSKGSKSATNSPRAFIPVVTAKLTTTRTRPQDDTVSKPTSTNKVGKSPGNSPRLVTPTAASTTIKKGKLKPAASTIKKVLEIEEYDPAIEEAGSTTSTPRLAPTLNLSPATSSSISSNATKVSKSAGNSPRLIKPVSKQAKVANKKSKQGELKEDLVCRTHKSNQKIPRKESPSPASSSRSLSVSSTYLGESLNTKPNEKKSRQREKGDISQSSKSSSIGEYSSSTSISEESSLSNSSCGGSRPHMSTDLRWDAIRQVKLRYGTLGLRNFKLLKRLGCGDIGTVYLAELSGANCLFALKVMDNEFLASRRKMPRAQTEREILQMLDHPFLPTLYAHFTTDKFSCLVMEYCPGGDLHVLRQKQPNRSFLEQSARFYVAEVLLALEYLHMLGVVYRDLKPENILVREDGHIMLSDFDLSLRCDVNPTLLRSSNVEPTKRVSGSGPCAESSCIDPFCLQPTFQVSCFSPRLISSTTRPRKIKADLASQVRPLPQLIAEPTSARSNSFVGTHEYLAPEIIKGEGHGSAVDWWTFGIFLYELLFGKTPFKGPGNEDTLANVVLQGLRFPESPMVSYQAKDLIKNLLVKEPENRLGSVKGATEIKQHPFFEGLNWALIRCAVPPELPKGFDYGSLGLEEEKKSEEHFEFELF